MRSKVPTQIIITTTSFEATIEVEFSTGRIVVCVQPDTGHMRTGIVSPLRFQRRVIFFHHQCLESCMPETFEKPEDYNNNNMSH